MKKYFLILPLFIFCLSVFSQTATGNVKLRPEYYQSDFKKKDLQKLKDAKVFFIVPRTFKDVYEASDYEEILKDVWTFSDIKIIEDTEITDNLETGNVFIRYYSRRYRKDNMILVFNYFKLSAVNKIKEKDDGGFKYWDDKLGFMFFTTNVDARMDMVRNQDTIYGDLLDFRMGYLKNYFQQWNDALIKGEGVDMYDDYVDEKKIRHLKKKNSLYVPKNILYGFNALTGQERDKSAEELFKDYPYEYITISANELSNNIIKDEEPFYYLMYHQKNAHKIITIVESTSGQVIYRTAKNLSYNIKPKDIRAILKKMK